MADLIGVRIVPSWLSASWLSLWIYRETLLRGHVKEILFSPGSQSGLPAVSSSLCPSGYC